MKPTARIAAAEWEVMNLIWAASPVPAAELIDELGRKKGWAPRTTRTLLARLVHKQALTFEKDGPRYLYRPKVRLEDCVRHESRSFLDRVFGGEPAAMLMQLVKETNLSPNEIAELRRILKEKEK